MIEILNWIAQDSSHFLGTLLFIWVIGNALSKTIHGKSHEED